ncbi:MAG: transcription elongation factor Spt5 [Candidatus Micrarchaeia archaeon]
MYFVVKVTAGQERIIANILQNKNTKEDSGIYSIMVVEGMRGYIIVEAEEEAKLKAFITKDRNIRGVLPKPISDSDINRFIEATDKAMNIEKGDIIEFTSGPFKGYKAKVLKTDEVKDDITVELMDVVVSIPVTTKRSSAKIVQKAEKAS